MSVSDKTPREGAVCALARLVLFEGVRPSVQTGPGVPAGGTWGLLVEGVALDVDPLAALDLVDRELLVGGVAVLVERDLAGHALEGDLAESLDDLGAGVGGQLAAVGGDDGLDGLDDGPAGVVGVAAVGRVRVLVVEQPGSRR